MNSSRFNAYRIMWVFVFFDLPTETKADRKNHDLFRKNVKRDGFVRFQLSIYLRHCASAENAQTHIDWVKSVLPPKGFVVILRITDKQFGDIELFYGEEPVPRPSMPQQLELF